VVVSIGPAQAQETIRTALAIGADRGILIQTDEIVEPLAVAKLLRAVVEQEQPQLVSWASRPSTTTPTPPGQMLAAMLDWPQATFASKLEVSGDTPR
jgi:electron transfer flavoprotein beta subunit